MRLFLYISDFIVPFMILSILIYGIFAGVNVYDTFIQGAKRGFWTVVRLMPTLIGLMAAVGILRASGFLEFISEIIGNVTEQIGFPGALVPLTIVKMFSSSAATGLLLDIYKEFGTDSRNGMIASISMACTETIFYVSKGEKNQVYSCRSTYCNICRACSECVAGSTCINKVLNS